MPVDISFCIHNRTNNVVSKIYSAREKEREQVCVLYGRNATNIFIMYRRRENQEKKSTNTHTQTTHCPYTKHSWCAVRAATCAHTLTLLTLSLFRFATRTTTTTTAPAFWLFAFLVPYIIYTVCACVCLRYFFSFFCVFFLLCFIECNFFSVETVTVVVISISFSCARWIVDVVVVAANCLRFTFLKFFIGAACYVDHLWRSFKCRSMFSGSKSSCEFRRWQSLIYSAFKSLQKWSKITTGTPYGSFFSAFNSKIWRFENSRVKHWPNHTKSNERTKKQTNSYSHILTSENWHAKQVRNCKHVNVCAVHCWMLRNSHYCCRRCRCCCRLQ